MATACDCLGCAGCSTHATDAWRLQGRRQFRRDLPSNSPRPDRPWRRGTASHTGAMEAGFAPDVGHGFAFEVVRETARTFRYNSIALLKGGLSHVRLGGPRQGPGRNHLHAAQKRRGDVADEIDSFMAIAAAQGQNRGERV